MAMGIISTLDVVVCCLFSFDETAPNVSAVAYANLCSWKKGREKKSDPLYSISSLCSFASEVLCSNALQFCNSNLL